MLEKGTRQVGHAEGRAFGVGPSSLRQFDVDFCFVFLFCLLFLTLALEIF